MQYNAQYSKKHQATYIEFLGIWMTFLTIYGLEFWLLTKALQPFHHTHM